jgi:adenine-specific DNA-methyltransferase
MEELTRTYGIKYIGSKNKIVSYIIRAIKDICSKDDMPDSPKVIDVFTGTTRVSQGFRSEGWTVIASDLAWASECYAELFLKTSEGEIDRLRELASELDRIGVDSPKRGWITNTYCDVLPLHSEGSRVRVWRPENGMRADSIRDTIAEWVDTKKITESDGKRLVALLIFALDSVDSTVGVQQAYLKNWSGRSSKVLSLESYLPPKEWEVWRGVCGEYISGNSLEIRYPKADIAYIDPPYTTHSYATYYHIWDSITKWDKPEVGLKTNRRIDRVARSDNEDMSMKSTWNVKRKVVESFKELVLRLPVKYVIISYSNEALVPISDLVSMLNEICSCYMLSIDHKRNIMGIIGNGANPSNHTDVTEYLIVCGKSEVV